MPRKENTPAERAESIWQAIEAYPGGLGFATPDGRPILVNDRMKELTRILTGDTVTDANETWKALENGQAQPGCRRIRAPWLFQDEEQSGVQQWNLVYEVPGSQVWHLERIPMTAQSPGIIQLTATDITRLYRMSEELYENNERLASLQERQQMLLKDIVQINQEKELTAAQSRLNEQLQNGLTGAAEKTPPAAGRKSREQLPRRSTPVPNVPEETPEAELLQVAQMIGCRICFEGPRPAGRAASQLFYAAIREALTNAVRHAGANCLTVRTESGDDAYRVTIADNGHRRVSSLREGAGLSGLRRNAEQQGAQLQVRCGDGVTLELRLPKEEVHR